MHIELIEPSEWLRVVLEELDKRGIILNASQTTRLLNTYTNGFFSLISDSIYAEERSRWDEEDRMLDECEQKAQEAVKGFFGDKSGKKK